MLELATILLVTLLVAAISVRLYRSVMGWRGFNKPVIGRRDEKVRMKLSPQQGYITLYTSPREAAKKVKFRKPKGSIRAPWGW